MDWMKLTEKQVLDESTVECLSQLVMIKDNQIAEHQRNEQNRREAELKSRIKK